MNKQKTIYHKKLGLTEYYQDKDGRQIRRIKDWTKRNDHRHHAMDALTIAFTKRSHIQYLNNLNARLEKGTDDYINLRDYNTLDIPANIDVTELSDLNNLAKS